MVVIAVNSDLITWAREYRGLTLEEAARKLSLSVEDMRAIEGGAPVNLTLFRKISDRLRVPRATLLRQTRPEAPPPPADFRTFVNRQPTIGFETNLAISYAYTIEQNILELVEAECAPPTPALPHLQEIDDAENAGERERERLGVGAATQMIWPFDDAFRNWRSIIEARGVYVLLIKFDLQDALGFSVYRNPNAPIIVINKTQDYDPMRTFTLLHEYAHILRRHPGISDQDDRNPVEAYCNRFAGAFLLPRTVLREVLPVWPQEPREWNLADVRHWARRLKVSQQALAIRLERLGVAPQGFFNRVVEQQEARAPRGEPGGNYVNTQVNELGYQYTSAILAAEGRNRIGPSEAAEMLDLAPRHFERVRFQIDNQNQRVGLGG